MVGVTEGDGQGVGGVDLRLLQQAEQVHDHQLHLLLVGTAGADHGLLDLAGGVLGHAQTLLHRRDYRRAARLAELQRRVGVARHEHLLDAEHHRTVLADHLAHAAVDLLQALGQRAVTGADAAGGDVLAAAPGVAHHAVAGDARTGVDAEDQGHAGLIRTCPTARPAASLSIYPAASIGRAPRPVTRGRTGRRRSMTPRAKPGAGKNEAGRGRPLPAVDDR